MIDIVTIETSSLGDRSYLVHDGRQAVVVDPQRDVDRILDLTSRLGVAISHVAETHVHNDYVSGGLDLAARTGAQYLLPARSGAEFDHVSADDGHVIEASTMRLEALHTPGHTDHHTSYVLTDADPAATCGGAADRATARAVFTGGSLLHGATGRTDLSGPDRARPLAHAQFHSVRRLAAQLADDVAIFPTHGFGSFCSATPTIGSSSTVGDQRQINPALTQGEAEYVQSLLDGLGEVPAYYAQMGRMNRRGPVPVDLALPERVDAGVLRSRLDAGEWVVDLRSRTAFAAGHLAGSLGFELSPSFVTYLGWLYSYGTPLTLIGTDDDQVAAARRELARIGIDDLAGAAIGDIADLAGAEPLSSYRVSDFASLARALDRARSAGGGPIQVVDARGHGEFAAGHLRGAINIPVHELSGRIADVGPGEVWVYCGSGYRASIAASILDREGLAGLGAQGRTRDLVLVDDSYASRSTGASSANRSPGPGFSELLAPPR